MISLVVEDEIGCLEKNLHLQHRRLQQGMQLASGIKFNSLLQITSVFASKESSAHTGNIERKFDPQNTKHLAVNQLHFQDFIRLRKESFREALSVTWLVCYILEFFLNLKIEVL